jgi:hypothetical protein
MLSPRHGDEDHSSMDMGGAAAALGSTSGSSSSHMMMSVFQNDMATPLYSEGWTPTTAGAYAGTIIFLIFLAIFMRVLIAGKAWAEARWLDAEMKRRYVAVQGKLPLAEQVSQDSLSKKMTLTANGVEEEVMVVQKNKQHLRPWRLTVDPLRALLDTSIAGVGYLL